MQRCAERIYTLITVAANRRVHGKTPNYPPRTRLASRTQALTPLTRCTYVHGQRATHVCAYVYLQARGEHNAGHAWTYILNWYTRRPTRNSNNARSADGGTSNTYKAHVLARETGQNTRPFTLRVPPPPSGTNSLQYSMNADTAYIHTHTANGLRRKGPGWRLHPPRRQNRISVALPTMT